VTIAVPIRKGKTGQHAETGLFALFPCIILKAVLRMPAQDFQQKTGIKKYDILFVFMILISRKTNYQYFY
jgi:hypothetical protein